MKKTPWFPVHVKPILDGVYETKMRLIDGTYDVIRFSKFERGVWGDSKDTAHLASIDKCVGSQFKEWRGLAKEPK